MKRRPERDRHLLLLMSQVNAVMAEKGISQAELARRMETDRSSVSKMLKLQIDPLASTLAAMAKALDCDLFVSPNEDRV